jgi:putative Mn2+ efflux pump MntP
MIGRRLRQQPLPSWLLAILLSISSSTDNFVVGTSVALAGGPHSVRVNSIIAVCNSLAALSSAAFGALAGDAAPMIAPLAAAAIFSYLAFDEVRSLRGGEDMSPLAQKALTGVVWRLALPMSLNNLAGGVASGVAGVGPTFAGLAAFLASYIMFRWGHFAGEQLGTRVEEYCEPRVLSAVIFSVVALLQFHEALQ